MTTVLLLAAYATGIILAYFFAPCEILGHSLSISLLALCWLLLRRSRWSWAPLFGLMLITGVLNTAEQLEPPNNNHHISRFAGPTTRNLVGRVVKIEQNSTGRYRLLLEMLETGQKGQTTRATGRLLLYVKTGALRAQPGQVVAWHSRLRRPGSFGNPGEFNYPLYLAAQNIYTTAFIVQAEDLAVLVNHPEKQAAALENFRQSLACYIDSTSPDGMAGYLKALLLGMSGGINKAERKTISESGVAHLFAISGLHFGLLAFFLYQASKKIYVQSLRLVTWCPPQRILPLALLPPMALYMLLTGHAWATQRAFLMVAIVAMLLILGRRVQTMSLLAAVALGLLLHNPLALFQPGFQLSFAGVAGILIWVPGWMKQVDHLPQLLRWPLTLLLTTTAATLATAPGVLWHFHYLTPAGLLTNLVAIPLVAWGTVPIGLLSLAAVPFSSFIAKTALLTSALLLKLAISAVASISNWPGLSAIPHYLTTSQLALMIGAIMAIMPWRRMPWHCPYRVFFLLIAVGAAWLLSTQYSGIRVTALSVGQGDATLVSLGNDKHYLVDGGGMPAQSFDPGEQLIAPALGRMGVTRLSGVILSHNHPDHSSGLTYLLQRFPVDNFYFAGKVSELTPELQTALHNKPINIIKLQSGWTEIESQTQQKLRLFTPSQNVRDLNERSLVLFAGDDDAGVLLTADLGKTGLQQMINLPPPGRISLLKLPHHGSRHARPELFLEWAAPELAFVSCGRDNPYGFPHIQAVESCLQSNILLHRTDLDGLLQFRLQDGKWQVTKGHTL